MRVAAVQSHAIADDLDKVCALIAQRLRWADEESVDLVLFSEAFLLGHSYDPDAIRSRARGDGLGIGKAALEHLGDPGNSGAWHLRMRRWRS